MEDIISALEVGTSISKPLQTNISNFKNLICLSVKFSDKMKGGNIIPMYDIIYERLGLRLCVQGKFPDLFCTIIRRDLEFEDL